MRYYAGLLWSPLKGMYAGRAWTADVGENPGMYEVLSRVTPAEMGGHPIEEIVKSVVRPSRESAQREADKELFKAARGRRYFGPWVGLVVAQLESKLVYEAGEEPDEHEPSRFAAPDGVSTRLRFFTVAVPVEGLAAELVRLGTEDGYALRWESAREKEAALALVKLELPDARESYRESAKPGFSRPKGPLAAARREHRRVAYAAMSPAVHAAYV
jgi:hypothetical protein